jgi:hypothetical protein
MGLVMTNSCLVKAKRADNPLAGLACQPGVMGAQEFRLVSAALVNF